MIFKWMKAKNFLSIGEEGVHIIFDQLSDMILVKGKNLDISPESSNAAGKSTLLEIIVYGLFGKVIKELPHKEVIHKKTKKGLVVEVCFEMNGVEHIVCRKRKPDSLTLAKDGVNETTTSVQQAILDIVKLNHESFGNIVCFGEHNNHAFLACDAEGKRTIIESLLGLEKYIKYCKTAKDILKEAESKLVVYKKKYEGFQEQKDNTIQRINQMLIKQKNWKDAKELEIGNIKTSLAGKFAELAKSNDGNAVILYEQAQERIKGYKEKIIKLETDRAKYTSVLEELKPKIEFQQTIKNSLSTELLSKQNEVTNKQSQVNILTNQVTSLKKLTPGVKCSACYGTVDVNNYQYLIDHNVEAITIIKNDILLLTGDKDKITEKLKDATAEVDKWSSLKKQADDRNNAIYKDLNNNLSLIQKDSQIQEPQTGAREIVLKEQIKELNKRLESKREELEKHDPYVEMLNQANDEKVDLESKVTDVKVQIDDSEKMIPYYEYWVGGFGDDGIRSYIIDGILPALNARINYWLQFLIDNKITLTFDNKFDVTIERNPPDGDPFVYNATSAGERRRINLAISQAFAHIMMVSSGTCPNIIYLDEVALNVDLPGVHGMYKMICELAKDRKVFVTTHDPNLSDLLSSCDVIMVTKKDGFSKIDISK